jgi:DNA polymerase III subunit epsilon
MPFNAWLDRLRRRPRWDTVVLWALDLETSGLRPGADQILSVGMVPIRDGTIRYGERYHSLVRPRDVENLSTEGLRAHHLLPAELAGAPVLADVLPEVDRRLREGILLLHCSSLDLGFLRDAYRRCRMSWPKTGVVDTVDMVLQLHRAQQRWVPYAPPARTSLPEARAALGLPTHRHHDALFDALATAELFLALRSRMGLCTLNSSSR